MIDSETGLLGVIGDPIVHSLSPKLHNFLLKKFNLNYRYLAFRVARGRLKGALDGMRSLGIRGFNITVPHKEQVVRYLDRLSEEARVLGAVNTVLNTSTGNGNDGELIGYNTDSYGFSESLKAHDIDPRGWRVVILGAGGGAAAVAYALLEQGAAHISIYNRTAARAKALAERLSMGTGSLSGHGLTDDELVDDVADAQLLVHASPVGMFAGDEVLIAPELLHERLIVYDLIYNPSRTRLLREAEAHGARAINGLDMLIYQGLKSLEIWTGAKFDRAIVAELSAHLQEGLHG